MADTDAKKALLTAANSFLTAQGFGGNVQWENKQFDPAGKASWASVFFIPNVPSVVTLGGQGDDRMTGLVQIDFNIPSNTGDGAMNSWENAARAEFVAGKAYTLNGVSAIIINAGLTPGRTVDNWFRKSLTINFRADLARAAI